MGGTTLPEIGLPGGGPMSTPGLPVGLPPPALGQATNAINFSVGNPLPAATASSSPGVLGVANAFGGTEAMKLAPGAAQVQQKTQQERNPAPNIIPQARGTATSIAPPRNPSAEANGGAANPTPSVDDTNSQSNTKVSGKSRYPVYAGPSSSAGPSANAAGPASATNRWRLRQKHSQR